MKKASEMESEYNEYMKLPSIYLGYNCLKIPDYRIPNHRLIYISARPEVGKTNLSLNIGYRLLRQYGGTIIYYSFEMVRFEIRKALMKIASNDAKTSEYFYIEDSAKSIGEIIAQVKDMQYKEKHTIRAIFIDTLRGLKTTGVDKNSYMGMMRIATELESLRNVLSCPIIVLCHLRKDKPAYKPVVIEDIRGVGIEESGDLIFGLYRPELQKFIHPEEKFREANKLYMSCLKNRYGMKYEHLFYFNKENLQITEEDYGTSTNDSS